MTSLSCIGMRQTNKDSFLPCLSNPKGASGMHKYQTFFIAIEWWCTVIKYTSLYCCIYHCNIPSLGFMVCDKSSVTTISSSPITKWARGDCTDSWALYLLWDMEAESQFEAANPVKRKLSCPSLHTHELICLGHAAYCMKCIIAVMCLIIAAL